MGSVGQQWQKYTYDEIGFCTTLEERLLGPQQQSQWWQDAEV